MIHEDDLNLPLRKLRFANGLLEVAAEAHGVWLELKTPWKNGRPFPEGPPVGKRACIMKMQHSIDPLKDAIEALLKFYS